VQDKTEDSGATALRISIGRTESKKRLNGKKTPSNNFQTEFDRFKSKGGI
jgi:hypothetical protein